MDVEVDPDTGKVDILRYTAFIDAGTSVHPSYVEGQVQGATVQGIGWALNEEYFYTDDGTMANSSFLDYRMPTSLDVPMIDTVPGRGAQPAASLRPARSWRGADHPATGRPLQRNLQLPSASECTSCPCPPVPFWKPSRRRRQDSNPFRRANALRMPRCQIGLACVYEDSFILCLWRTGGQVNPFTVSLPKDTGPGWGHGCQEV